VQLQQSLDEIRSRGLGLAAISYDAPVILKTFAAARGITFPLLADAGSDTIRRYNILNAEATGRTAGIPYPGTFVVDPSGVVVSRAFEEAYQERASAAGILAAVPGSKAGPGASAAETKHLKVTASATDALVAPGTRFSLLLDVTPKPRMHVYAPDQTTYIPVAIALDPSDEFKAHAPVFPASEPYLFRPLKETQRVFSKPFRIVQDVTVALTPAVRARAREEGATLIVMGTLRYQACDDAICYLPASVPVSWTVRLRPLER
jgi:hypothetical protein